MTSPLWNDAELLRVKRRIDKSAQKIVDAAGGHPYVTLVDFQLFTTKFPLTIGAYSSSTDISANFGGRYRLGRQISETEDR